MAQLREVLGHGSHIFALLEPGALVLRHAPR
jgi:hypothetical protein